LQGLAIEDGWYILHIAIWTIFSHLVYFMAILYILWLCGIFFHFGMFYREKSDNPAFDGDFRNRFFRYKRFQTRHPF
jgi:hypothetical protein